MNKNGEKEGKRSKGQKKDYKMTKTNKAKVKETTKENKVAAEEKKREADDISKKFPNFSLLTEEERSIFFQALTEARKNVEQKGVPTRDRFGTVHDEYLKYFSQNDEKEKGVPDEARPPLKSNSATISQPPPVQLQAKEDKKSWSPTLQLEDFSNFKGSEIEAMKSGLLNQCESVIQQDTDKVLDMYLKKKKRNEAKSESEGKKPDQTGERKTSKKEIPEHKKMRKKKEEVEEEEEEENAMAYHVSENPAKTKETPQFDALTAEEREMFFNTLQEARENIVGRNPNKKNKIPPLDAIMQRYKDDRPATSVYTTRVQEPHKRRPEGKKNLRVRVTLTSGDNERILKAKSAELEEKRRRHRSSEYPAVEDFYHENTKMTREDPVENLEYDKSKQNSYDSINNSQPESSETVNLKASPGLNNVRLKEHNMLPSSSPSEENPGEENKEENGKSKPEENKSVGEDLKKMCQRGGRQRPEDISKFLIKKKKDAEESARKAKEKKNQEEAEKLRQEPFFEGSFEEIPIGEEKLLKGKEVRMKGEWGQEQKYKKEQQYEQERKHEQDQEYEEEQKYKQDQEYEEEQKYKQDQEYEEEQKYKQDQEYEEEQYEQQCEPCEPCEQCESREPCEPCEPCEQCEPREPCEQCEPREPCEQCEPREPCEQCEPREPCVQCEGEGKRSNLNLVRPECDAEPCNECGMPQEVLETNCPESCTMQARSAVFQTSLEIPKETKTEMQEKDAEGVREGKSTETYTTETRSAVFQTSLEIPKDTKTKVQEEDAVPANTEEAKVEDSKESSFSGGAMGYSLKPGKSLFPRDSEESDWEEGGGEEVRSEEEEGEGEGRLSEGKGDAKEFLGVAKSAKVMIVDDNVIEKIRKLICYLEAKAGKDDRLEKEYMKLLVDYVDYLSKVLEALVRKKERRKQVQNVYPAGVSLKFDEHNEPRKGKKKSKGGQQKEEEKHMGNDHFMPRSVSAQDFGNASVIGFNKNEAEKSEEERGEEKSDSEISASLSDSYNSLASTEDGRNYVPPSVISRKTTTTKIRLLQDLLKKRAELVSGSTEELKIVQHPQPEFVPEERPPTMKLITEEDEERIRQGRGYKFVMAFINCLTCGRKKQGEEGVFENLKGEAVRVDVYEGEAKDPANATLNRSTMEVLRSAGRRRLIDKYYTKT